MDVRPVKEQKGVESLLQYLRRRVFEQDARTVEGDEIDDFLKRADAVMRENQAVGLDYLSTGIALRLQDGTIVSWIETGETQPEIMSGGNTGEARISNPTERTLKRGIEPSHSFPVTGTQKQASS